MATRKRPIIGLAFGESSLLAAELSADGALRATAEFPFPAGVTDPAALGKALADYLKSKGFSARTAVAGLSARRLAVKAKEVPPADRSTLNELLRLQAEGEFAAELKELVYDYEGQPSTTSVLLMATQKSNLDFVNGVAEGAGLSLATVMPTAVALGHAVNRASAARQSDALILSTMEGSAELTSFSGDRLTALRGVRAGAAGELKRAILPIRGNARELTVFGEAADPTLLPAPKAGELLTLGITGTTAGSGDARFAPAAALALAGQAEHSPSVDFLHTKLAPPKEHKIPRWAIGASVAALLVFGGIGWAWSDLSHKQADVQVLQSQFAKMKPSLDEAKIFVDNASIAQAWHNSEPRYLECLREVTATFPEDGQSYGININVREASPPKPGAIAAPANPKKGDAKSDGTLPLTVTLAGKTTTAREAQAVVDAFGRNSAFTAVKSLGSSENGNSRNGQSVSFSLSFNYKPSPPSTQPSGETYVSTGNSSRRDRSERDRSDRSERSSRSSRREN